MEYIQMLEKDYKKAQFDRLMNDKYDGKAYEHEIITLGHIKDVYRRTKNEIHAEHMGDMINNEQEIKQFNEDLKQGDILSIELFSLDRGGILIKYTKAVTEVGNDYGVMFHNTTYEYIEAMLQPYKELYPNIVFNH